MTRVVRWTMWGLMWLFFLFVILGQWLQGVLS
jgi:hypothetical protein